MKIDNSLTAGIFGPSHAPAFPISGIGSLPHHNVDSALEYSFKHSLPYLPQIPLRNPWEYMIAQCLEGLPGIQAERDGTVLLDIDVWHSRANQMNQSLDRAFEKSDFERFEPSAATSSSWQPFVWELEDRKVSVAKIQLAGPFTSQYALRLSDQSKPDKYPDLCSQIFRMLLARALAMTLRLKSIGVVPVFFLDEPGLFGISGTHPKAIMGLQELKVTIQTLQKAGAVVGLHCCGNTDWKTILQLGLDIISLDVVLSLEKFLREIGTQPEMILAIRSGAQRLSLGVIPTSMFNISLQSVSSAALFEILCESVRKGVEGTRENEKEFLKTVLRQSLYTPACGLAYHTTQDAEVVLDLLAEFQVHARSGAM